MGIIIAIGLGMVFCGTGTLFYLVLLSEANTYEPWIATLICIVIVSIIICYTRVREISSIVLNIGIIVCLGVVQLIILRKIEIPYYWKEDITSVRLMSVFFDQPVIWLIGRGISRPFEVHFDNKAKNLIYNIEQQLTSQINGLKDIAHEIMSLNGSYKSSDDLVSLLSRIGDNTLEDVYISARTKKDADLLARIADISARDCLNINTENKTLSAINIDVGKRIQDKTKLLEEVTAKKFSRKDCRYLEEKLKMIKNER